MKPVSKRNAALISAAFVFLGVVMIVLSAVIGEWFYAVIWVVVTGLSVWALAGDVKTLRGGDDA